MSAEATATNRDEPARSRKPEITWEGSAANKSDETGIEAASAARATPNARVSNTFFVKNPKSSSGASGASVRPEGEVAEGRASTQKRGRGEALAAGRRGQGQRG